MDNIEQDAMKGLSGGSGGDNNQQQSGSGGGGGQNSAMDKTIDQGMYALPEPPLLFPSPPTSYIHRS